MSHGVHQGTKRRADKQHSDKQKDLAFLLVTYRITDSRKKQTGGGKMKSKSITVLKAAVCGAGGRKLPLA